MKESKKCSKCNGTNIYKVDLIKKFYEHNSGGLPSVLTTPMYNSFVDTYACSDCGFTEIYFSDPSELTKEGSKSSSKWS